MLTAKQEQFVQNIIQGMSQADAYRAAYNCEKMSDNAIYVNASKLVADTKVALRLRELRDELAKPSIMTAQERLEYLTRVIKGEELEQVVQVVNGEKVEIEIAPAIKTKLNAIDIMNKMQGEYVTKVEGSLSVVKLEDLI